MKPSDLRNKAAQATSMGGLVQRRRVLSQGPRVVGIAFMHNMETLPQQYLFEQQCFDDFA